MQMGFYFDQTRCTGCYTCIVACKDWHDVPAGPAAWRQVATFEKGRYPELFVAHLATSCYHCASPACADACPTGAITKREADGVVVVDREACLGHDRCDMCFQACPYGAPQFGAEENAKMQKCNFCVDRLAEGKLPICVAGCPMRALDSGPLEQMKARAGTSLDAEGFVRDDALGPCIVFKPMRDTRRRALMRKDNAPYTVRQK
ncbi:MAG: 4Fe-4S dicluster domain-containing protein [Chloroflexi bacterium]|nr:4Fe-4S dicluster domain-containing protein [Chloroflexota bacterium]